MKKLKRLPIIFLTLLFLLASSSLVFASKITNVDDLSIDQLAKMNIVNKINPSDLTPEQLKELKDAKDRTEKLRQQIEMEHNSRPQGEVRALSYTGSRGDLLITVDTGSGSSNSSSWAGGHVAVVYDQYNTLESYGKYSGDLNGVKWWTTDWSTRYTHFKGCIPNGATSTQRNNAGFYALNQYGEPYNMDFWDKWTTDAWYCSQLGWRSWYEQGYDTDSNGSSAVWPVDVYQSSSLRTLYSQ
jgi:uncharacterized protein YycO